METDQLEGILDFLRHAEKLKDTLRSAYTSKGRHESTAEHSWRLSLMALVLGNAFPDMDMGQLLKLCIIHDLGEALNGDIPAVETPDPQEKCRRERRDLTELARSLPPAIAAQLLGLWEEYETGASPEAKLVKALDKLETLLQHTQGRDAGNIDYRFNLGYGRHQTDYDPLTRRLRAMIDVETRRRAEESGRHSDDHWRRRINGSGAPRRSGTPPS